MSNHAHTYFELGLTALRADKGLEALRAFEMAHAQDPSSVEYQSYVALLNALERGRGRESVDLGRAAAERAPEVLAVHVNLGRIHLKLGDKASALEAFRAGLVHHPESAELLDAIRRLGVRRPPPFKRLPRDHFLNKYVGKLAAKLGLR